MDEKSYLTENRRRRLRYEGVFLGLVLAALIIVVLNINIGSVPISVREIARILFLRQGEMREMNIIWQIRLPRILTAALLGGALALAGFLLQTFFANPIAGPFVLGISHGAKLLVAIAMIYFVGHFGSMSSFVLVAAAFLGSMMSTGFILTAAAFVLAIVIALIAAIVTKTKKEEVPVNA